MLVSLEHPTKKNTITAEIDIKHFMESSFVMLHIFLFIVFISFFDIAKVNAVVW